MRTSSPNESDAFPQGVRCALVSVGGASLPLVFTLRQHRPRHVWYFCSGGSRKVAEEIHAELDWHPDRDFIEVEQFEELGPCYRELRAAIPALLRKWKVAPAEVLVDYTGGTKTMSAALVLAATELFDLFSYVGGDQREKGGIGITVDGREKVFYQANPWSELAVREVERARDLWAGCLFDGAGTILRATATRVPQRIRFESLADLADALAARHRLDFRRASSLLGPVQGKLPALYDGQDDHGLIAFVRQAHEICQACAGEKASSVLLRELLDNALRTATQGRFEDAAARLHRAMEMQGQLWLADATQGVFINGRKKAGAPLPPALAGLEFCQPNASGEVKLSLEQLFRALDRLGHPCAVNVVADLALEHKSRWRLATEQRNAGILAHGVKSISSEGFESMKQIAADFLTFDLSGETNPVLPLDARWLQRIE